jgi:subtilisin
LKTRVLAACFVVALACVYGAGAGAAVVPGQYVVVVKPGGSRVDAERGARSLGGEVFMEYRYALNGFAVRRLSSQAAASLERNPNVDFVSPDAELAAACSPSATAQCVGTGLLRIGADRSSTRSGDGRGSVNVNVAVIDSGIDVDHPDLNVVGGVDCANGQSYDDAFGHGTHVAGRLAARDNGFGTVGVAPGARLWAVRVLNDHDVGPDSNIICGVDWVTGTRVDSDPTNDIAVANMSLGGPAKPPDDGDCGRLAKDPLHLAICNSTAAGIPYVVAAGNESGDIADFAPADYDEVLAVTAMADSDGLPGAAGPATCVGDSDDTPAIFSDFATLPADAAHTVAAPGECVGSTWLNGTYAGESGTSMAAPHVSGVIALCIASGRCAGLSAAQIIHKIVADAAAYNSKSTGYGFAGDPLRPIAGKYYGYLIRGALY